VHHMALKVANVRVPLPVMAQQKKGAHAS